MTSVAQPDISLVLVNYRSEDYIVRCLASVAASQTPLEIEVLVVDNSPSSLRQALKDSPAVVVIENGENAGFARACNQGIARARGTVVVLLNPDTELCPGALVRLLQSVRAHPRTAAVAARLVNPDGSLQPSCRPLPGLVTALLDVVGVPLFYPRPPLFGWLNTGPWAPERVRWVAQPMGACLCIRRDAIEDIGLLDERFFVYFEDVDWCLRARNRDWRILYDPRAEVIHHEGRSSARDVAGACRAYYNSKLRFYRKHFSGIKLALLIGLLLLEIGVKYSAWTTLGRMRKHWRERVTAFRGAWRAVVADVGMGNR